MPVDISIRNYEQFGLVFDESKFLKLLISYPQNGIITYGVGIQANLPYSRVINALL